MPACESRRAGGPDPQCASIVGLSTFFGPFDGPAHLNLLAIHAHRGGRADTQANTVSLNFDDNDLDIRFDDDHFPKASAQH
jgi:hypothetical protein